MSSPFAEHLSKYGYSTTRPDGAGNMKADFDAFDPFHTQEWPTVVNIQTVADFVSLRDNKKESFIAEEFSALKEDSVTMVPPYPLLFLEFRSAGFDPHANFDPTQVRLGVVLRTTRVVDENSIPAHVAHRAVADGAGGCSWYIELEVYQQGSNGEAFKQPMYMNLYLDGQGSYMSGSLEPTAYLSEHNQKFAAYMMDFAAVIALNACKFWHVRKATVAPVADADTLRRKKKAIKRGRPFLQHHRLVIEPLEKYMAHVRSVGGKGSKKALHTVRGTWATYTEDNPLFGHWVGTVWRPPHIRGSKSLGMVTKDYEMGKVEDEEGAA